MSQVKLTLAAVPQKTKAQASYLIWLAKSEHEYKIKLSNHSYIPSKFDAHRSNIRIVSSSLLTALPASVAMINEMAKNFSWNEKTNQAAWLLAPRSFSQSKCIPKNSLTRNGVASIHSRSALQSRLFSGSYWPGKDQIFVTRKNGQNSDPGFLRVYNSLILPQLDYADIVWDSGKKRHADMIQKLQNRAGRIILKVDPYSHTSNHTVHQILKWDTLDFRRTQHLLHLVYKALNELTPLYLSELFNIKENIYSLRSDYNIDIQMPRNNYCKRMVSYRGGFKFNSLPLNVKRALT